MALPQYQDVPESIRLYVDQQVELAKQEMARRIVDNQTEIERYYAVRFDEVLREVRAMRKDESQILSLLQAQSATLEEHTTILKELLARE